MSVTRIKNQRNLRKSLSPKSDLKKMRRQGRRKPRDRNSSPRNRERRKKLDWLKSERQAPICGTSLALSLTLRNQTLKKIRQKPLPSRLLDLDMWFLPMALLGSLESRSLSLNRGSKKDPPRWVS